jgi:tripartite-type tricarboxylate transporter receptor subunit TctC
MRKVILALVLAAAAASVAPFARAENFPSRTITLLVPFPPGGSTDVAARIMADKMGASLGQPVIVENVGGAGGTIAVARLAHATPDGYTIDIGQWDTHVGLIIYNINFDLEKDFAPIGLMTVNPQLLVARKSFAANSLKELVTWLKAHPEGAKFVNQNASGQLGALLLQKLTDTKVLIIPYRGSGPALTDMMSGQVDLAVLQAAVSMPQLQAGVLKALANLSPSRSTSLPDIPTSDEAGVPGYYLSGWFGLYAPKGTPPEIVTRLNTAMVKALAEPDVRRRFTELGLDIAAREQQTPDGLAKFQKAEMEKWWPIIKASGIRGE